MAGPGCVIGIMCTQAPALPRHVLDVWDHVYTDRHHRQKRLPRIELAFLEMHLCKEGKTKPTCIERGGAIAGRISGNASMQEGGKSEGGKNQMCLIYILHELEKAICCLLGTCWVCGAVSSCVREHTAT